MKGRREGREKGQWREGGESEGEEWKERREGKGKNGGGGKGRQGEKGELIYAPNICTKFMPLIPINVNLWQQVYVVPAIYSFYSTVKKQRYGHQTTHFSNCYV